LTFTAWRITKGKHARQAFDGAGARKYGGRWNSPGTAVVYTSQSQSLAVLEMLVHLDGPELLERYVLIPVEIDKSLVEKIEIRELPRNWRAQPAPKRLSTIGDQWLQSGRSVVFEVPSALLPAESNFLLNPNHSDFHKLVIGDPVPYQFDSRMTKESK
jgi:RES domain-containing protein